MKKRTWILGASDPEMQRIEALLAQCGEESQPAQCAGRRCHPGNAYLADAAPAEGRRLVFVECAPAGGYPAGAMVIDHHRIGDPGFGRGPEAFLAASSIGQVLVELARSGELYGVGGARGQPLSYPPPPEMSIDSGGWVVGLELEADVIEIPMDIAHAAAADHCLSAAYRGGCQGVDPGNLAAWRDETRAAFQKRPVAEVRRDRVRAEGTIAGAPRLELGGEVVADLRGREIPELPEASARLGRAVLYSLFDKRTGKVKVGILGSSGPAVREFLANPVLLTGLYLAGEPWGDPARGFAGCFLAPSEEGGEA